MVAARRVLLETEFTVSEIRRQDADWAYGGIVVEKMPPGWFVGLSPAVKEVELSHFVSSLTLLCFRDKSEPERHDFDLLRQKENGHLELFFEEKNFWNLKVGDLVRVAAAQANQPHADDMEVQDET